MHSESSGISRFRAFFIFLPLFSQFWILSIESLWISNSCGWLIIGLGARETTKIIRINGEMERRMEGRDNRDFRNPNGESEGLISDSNANLLITRGWLIAYRPDATKPGRNREKSEKKLSLEKSWKPEIQIS